MRGKKSKTDVAVHNRKRSLTQHKATNQPQAKKAKQELEDTDLSPSENRQCDIAQLNSLIDGCDKTAFQKRCLKALLQIPPGQFSTYGEL